MLWGGNLEAADSKGIFGPDSSLDSLRTGSGVWNDALRAPVPGAMRVLADAHTTVLRYPGGCLAHGFDWKKTIGPRAQRGDWQFGLDEYLQLCRETKTTPLVTVSDYTGTPQDAADLVEYLNAPADAAHPWAKQRVQNGHAEPYGVVWFELGNESDHGNHQLTTPERRYSAEEYALYARQTAGAMKRVDPKIKVGIVTATLGPADDPWNAKVFKACGDFADFVVVHTYAVNYSQDDPNAPEDKLMRGAMASADQLEGQLNRYSQLIRENAGRDLPLANTEYNAGFVQQTPKPYRFSYGAALFSADWLRVLLKPGNRVFAANYWQSLNGYWGLSQGRGNAWTAQPALTLLRQWKHFGPTRVGVEVQSPRAHFEGVAGVKPTHGATYQAPTPLVAQLFSLQNITLPKGENYNAQLQNGVLSLSLNNKAGNDYPTMGTFARPQNAGARAVRYKLSFDACFVPALAASAATAPATLPRTLGLQLGDARGYLATRSALAIDGLQNAREWTHFENNYDALPDTQSVNLLARMEFGDAATSGRLEVRNLQVSASAQEQFPDYALLTASASRSNDGRTTYLVVFNKSTTRDLTTTINLPGFAMKSARRWVVNAPSLGTVDAKSVRETETGATTLIRGDGTLRHIFPAHSMTALEIKP